MNDTDYKQRCMTMEKTIDQQNDRMIVAASKLAAFAEVLERAGRRMVGLPHQAQEIAEGIRGVAKDLHV